MNLKAFFKNQIQRFFTLKQTRDFSSSQDAKTNIQNLLKLYFESNSIQSRLVHLILKFRTNWIFSDEIDINIQSENEKNVLSEIINSESFYKKIHFLTEILELQNHAVVIFTKNENTIDFDFLDLYDYDYDITDGKVVLKQNGKDVELNEDEYLLLNYSYKNKFTNSLVARTLTILNKIEQVENEIRKIHSIFVKQVPVIKFEDEHRIQQFINFTQNQRFELGDSLLLLKTEDFDFKRPDLNNLEYLFKEKLFLYQELSSLVGIPIFLLGFPELIGGGRATAKEYIELISSSIKKNRLLFKKFLEKILRRILYLRNKLFLETNDLNTKIDIFIPETINSIIFETLDAINEMRTNNLISHETYLNLNPFIRDTKDEIAKIENEKNQLSQNEINILGELQ